MKLTILAVLALLLASGTSQAEMTIGGLAELCSPDGIDLPDVEPPKSPGEALGQELGKKLVGGMSQVMCMGYIQGLEDGAAFMDEAIPADVRAAYQKSCDGPEGVTRKQDVAIFLKWAEDHPEHWHEPAAFGWFESGYEAFCTE